jgi:hypothetical protein
VSLRLYSLTFLTLEKEAWLGQDARGKCVLLETGSQISSPYQITVLIEPPKFITRK